GSRVGFDTDVNAPALAEFRHRCFLQEKKQQSQQQQDQQQQQNPTTASASSPPTTNTTTIIAKPLTSLSYITIGTGVGVGLILNSHPIHGLLHPEGGHVAIQPLEGDTFTGYSWGVEKSPYGGVGTVEGVASSVALTERYFQMEKEEDAKEEEGDSATTTTTTNDTNNAQTREVLSTLSDTHQLWNHAANAIANLCVSLLLLTSCQKIVLGGGIMKRTILYKMVRQRVWTLLNGYLDSVDELSEECKLDDVIVESSWEEMGSGLVGAFALALDAYEKDTTNYNNKGGERGHPSIQVGGCRPFDKSPAKKKKKSKSRPPYSIEHLRRVVEKDEENVPKESIEAHEKWLKSEHNKTVYGPVKKLKWHRSGGESYQYEEEEEEINEQCEEHVKDVEKRKKGDEQRLYTLGVLAGIGLSFGCVLLSSLLGRGIRQKH
ncbi:hypothetical protein ACHAXR_010454, partial [Thalassiosira sp. AJA248-18]